MAAVVHNNIPAACTINELNRNNRNLSKSLRKVSSGMKIEGAQDDASGYAISERMRVHLRGLAQDVQNVKNGRSMLSVAAGGIENIVEELRSLKELAINAANDHNSDLDRATLQKEFDHRMENINDIAATTNYNSKILLDGRYGMSRPKLSMEEPIGSAQPLNSLTMSSDGIYVIPKGFSGTVTISDTAKNVELRQEDPDTPLREVYITGPSGGGANIWLNGLNILNSNDGSIIKFRGDNNFLTIKGTNTIEYIGGLNYNAAVINVGNGLTLEGTGQLNIRNLGSMTCAGIGIDEGEHHAPDITVNSGTYNIYLNDDGAGIGASVNSTVGDIFINGGDITVKNRNGAGIGSTGDPYTYTNINSHAGNIVVGRNASIHAQSEYGAGIGTGSGYSTAQSITISRWAAIDVHSTYGEDIGEGVTGSVGSIDTDWDDSDITYGSFTEGKPLVIHHGTKAGQSLHAYIDDMRTKTLGLDGAKVTNQILAESTIAIIDEALTYALDQSTTIGAYISRLEYTETNLVISSENTQSSESTIRDADMAAEMMAYTRNNILSQAAQAMLAQANQDAGSILSLLQ